MFDVRTVCCVLLPGALLSLCTAGVWAQTRPQVLEVSTLYDGRGNILHDTRVVVQNGKVVRIDPKATGDIVDLRGLTVMPGWIDLHVHMTYHFGSNGKYGEPVCGLERGRGTNNAAGVPPTANAPIPPNASPTPCETQAEAELAIVHNAWATLQAGFTTVQSVGSPGDKELRGLHQPGRDPRTTHPHGVASYQQCPPHPG